MSNEIKNFLQNVSYVGIGVFIGTFFSFTFNLLNGRILGPTGYGEFSLVQSIGSFLYIPMMMGYSSAIVKYSAEKDNLDRQRTVISTTYILVFILMTASILIYLLIPQDILKYFSISKEIFNLSIVFAVLFVTYTLTTSTLKGLHEIKKYAMLTPIYSFVLLLVFLFFVSINFISYSSALISMFIAYIISIIVTLIFVRKYFVFKFDKLWAYKLTNYGLHSLIGGLAFVFYTNIDQILINMYMSIENVGIYIAYYNASIGVAYTLFGIFNSVFFPIASKCEDKTVILQRINKIIPYLIIFGVPSLILIEVFILKMYGSAYTINYPLILLFAIVSILIIYYGLYDWTFCSQGLKGVKLVNKSTILVAIINITLDLYLIPLLGISGAMISTAVAFAAGIYFLLERRNLL